MALYKNDVPFELHRNPKELEAIREYFHNKFPVKVVYTPDRVVKSRLKHNTKPDKPNSIAFDLKAIVKSPSGSEVWRYAENVITDDKGRKKYIPQSFILFGEKMLNENDIELIYFLLRKSSFCLGGDNQGPMTKFMFEDLVTEAEKKAEKKKIEAKVGRMLYDDDGLSEEKLRSIAKAYQITGVDGLTINQVRNMLEVRIFAKPEGPKEFFSMAKNDKEIQSRKVITDAKDKGILAYSAKDKNWKWKSVRENGNVLICSVPANKSPDDAIYDVFMGDDQFRADLQAAMLTGDPSAGKDDKRKKKEEEED